MVHWVRVENIVEHVMLWACGLAEREVVLVHNSYWHVVYVHREFGERYAIFGSECSSFGLDASARTTNWSLFPPSNHPSHFWSIFSCNDHRSHLFLLITRQWWKIVITKKTFYGNFIESKRINIIRFLIIITQCHKEKAVLHRTVTSTVGYLKTYNTTTLRS